MLLQSAPPTVQESRCNRTLRCHTVGLHEASDPPCMTLSSSPRWQPLDTLTTPLVPCLESSGTRLGSQSAAAGVNKRLERCGGCWAALSEGEGIRRDSRRDLAERNRLSNSDQCLVTDTRSYSRVPNQRHSSDRTREIEIKFH